MRGHWSSPNVLQYLPYLRRGRRTGGGIAFARMSREGSGIDQVFPLGGSEQKLVDAHFEYFTRWCSAGRRMGSSSRTQIRGLPGQFGIFPSDVVTSEKRWWGSLSADFMTSSVPAFYPDGKSPAVVCIARITSTIFSRRPASGGTGRRIARVQGDFTGTTWTADGGSLIYSADGDRPASPLPALSPRSRWPAESENVSYFE